MRNPPAIGLVTFELSDDFTDTLWRTRRLPELGASGKILWVKVRCDPTEHAVTSATAYILDATRDGVAVADTDDTVPPDNAVFYESDAVAFTGSATGAEIADTLNSGNGTAYKLGSKVVYDRSAPDSALCFGMLVEATGAFKFYVDVCAEVWTT